jgi:protein-S-isoprenylcysteine O-methyltransferase Ste14
MTPAARSQVQSQQPDPDVTTRIGGWLFRHRSSIPVPLAVAVLLLRIGEAPPSTALIAGGVVLTLLGELLRLWAVHHIGVISRTRSDRLGPLVAAGPFAFVRNPLYLGNIALWAGFALTARLVWLVPAIVVLLGLEYHAIVRWEERLLEARLDEDYRDYAGRVPRWIPAINRATPGERDMRDLSSASSASSALNPYPWRDTLFSERGTLLAIAAGYFLLWLKARF